MNLGQQLVVVKKQSNVCGAKGHSHFIDMRYDKKVISEVLELYESGLDSRQISQEKEIESKSYVQLKMMERRMR